MLQSKQNDLPYPVALLPSNGSSRICHPSLKQAFFLKPITEFNKPNRSSYHVVCLQFFWLNFRHQITSNNIQKHSKDNTDALHKSFKQPSQQVLLVDREFDSLVPL